MKRTIMAVIAGLMIMGGAAFWWTNRGADELDPKDEPKPEVISGPFTRSETVAVGEVLNAVRELNRLVVFQAYLTATTTTRESGWVTQSDQTMLTPAFVNYYIDMSKIGTDLIRVKGRTVLIGRPAILIERPNIDTVNVRIFNDGVWTSLTDISDRMRERNNKMARLQLVQRAKMRFLIDAARKAANAALAANVRNVLVARGITDIDVRIIN